VLSQASAREVAKIAIEGLNNVQGFRFIAVVNSPIQGRAGNLEFLAHFRR